MFRERPVFGGLASRQVGHRDLVAHSVAVLTPSLSALGTGMVLPTVVGPGFWISTLLGFGLAFVLALVFDEFASRFNAPGSLYAYAAKGLGASVALVVGVSLVLGYAALAGFGLTGAARRIQAAWTATGGDTPPDLVGWTLVLALTLVCGWMIHRGISRSSRAVLVIEAMSLAMLALIGVVWLRRYGVPGFDVLSLDGADPGRIFAGAALIATLTVAFESCAALGLETGRPLRTVPAAMRTSLLVCGGAFLAANLIGTVHSGRDSSSDWRWFNIGDEVSRPDAAVLVVLALSMIALALSASTALSRLLFSFAREGIVWPGLGRTNPQGVPVAATWSALALALAGPLAASAAARSVALAPGELLQATTLIMCVSYGCAAAALIPFLISLDELRPRSAVLALTGLGGVGAVTWHWVTRPEPGVSHLALALLGGVVALGLAWRLALARRAPHRSRRLGAHQEALAGDVALAAYDGGGDGLR
ncbi:amino acid permease [Nocardioides sp. dk4132]|uniref:APC family permease n=1 Tax=unclassified Nocardioides TaxID=2615069 RepID=UPI00129765B0|nr:MULTISPECIES: APC family permease [unclassified Nocardioides]MQW74846.1 amino acid permease [Nocardioides sp. dk4132]QGA06734.1 amino acid permease [Nocardioides sp. dk884]